jgi:hypothetical protein
LISDISIFLASVVLAKYSSNSLPRAAFSTPFLKKNTEFNQVCSVIIKIAYGTIFIILFSVYASEKIMKLEMLKEMLSGRLVKKHFTRYLWRCR